MKMLAAAIITAVSVCALKILFFHIKSRRPLRSAAINAFLGLAALAAVNLTARFTGVRIPINIYTLPGAAIFGIPACAAFITLNMLLL